MPIAAPSGQRDAMKRGGNGVKQGKRAAKSAGDPAHKPRSKATPAGRFVL